MNAHETRRDSGSGRDNMAVDDAAHESGESAARVGGEGETACRSLPTLLFVYQEGWFHEGNTVNDQVRVQFHERFPWKGVWWQVASFVQGQTKDGEARDGVVIIPQEHTRGGETRARRGHKNA